MANKMYGIEVELDCPYFANFRKPISTGTITTYLVPPFTTIRGLLSNALGLERDDYSLQEWELKIGIEIRKSGSKNKELSKILKLVSRERAFKCNNCGQIIRRSSKKRKCLECGAQLEEIPNYKRTFPSAPIHREFLIQPSYTIYLISGQDEIEKLRRALENPARPLYFGNSENLVDVSVSEPKEVEKVESKKVNTIAEGVHPDSLVEKLPYKFQKKGRRFQLEYKTVSIPKGRGLELTEKEKVSKIGKKLVYLS